MELKKYIAIKCRSCNYEWGTISEKAFVTCPNCQLKTPNKRSEVKGKTLPA